MPTRWTDPAPVIGGGTAVFAAAAVAATVADWSIAPTAWAGTALGALGFGLFTLQRRAARRGARTAQKGLVPPPV
ncbi:DUF2530 domain-containing protein [Rhodococcus corynebacterioides]|uniref:DUF2530 domain-containing protein n=2 Tax=Rhodococcoides corynebacterioides TaxID=53972 RepID=A0ABS7NZ12_9NOCA|nr:DUF2530 domain-containing protein [Rhodococcus corynebacterioides]MBY6365373.1 DUF2530 domain-containing protein [Rhodococcus corynebacterioides]MBY6408184.1 DUF2530 domain-containing protein [Rhodococcus corynebacterioides]